MYMFNCFNCTDSISSVPVHDMFFQIVVLGKVPNMETFLNLFNSLISGKFGFNQNCKTYLCLYVR